MDENLKFEGDQSNALRSILALFISFLLSGCGSLSPPHQEPYPSNSKIDEVNYSINQSKTLPPQAMSLGEISSLEPKEKDCSNQVGWERLMHNQVQMRGLEGKNPEELNPTDREFNAAAHQIIWSLRINCSVSKKAK